MEDKSFPKKDKVKYSVGEFLAMSHNTLVDNDQLAGIDNDLIAASYDINVRYDGLAGLVDRSIDLLNGWMNKCLIKWMSNWLFD